MKTAIIIADVAKQVVFVPENKTDKEALKMFSPNDDINLVVKEGMFCDRDNTYGYNIDFCQGGYLRPFDNSDALMLVLIPKEKVAVNNVSDVDIFREELTHDIIGALQGLSEKRVLAIQDFISKYTPRI